AYPSGNAGGITMEGKPVPQWRTEGEIPPPPALHPDWEARGLFVADAETKGGDVALDLPPGKLVSAAAYPVRAGQLDLPHAVDLTKSVANGKLSWAAPAGDWHVMAITEGRLYEGTHAQLSLNEKIPYVNLLMPEPTARFLEVTHDRYAERLGTDLGKTFVSTFTDEPSLMSVFLRKMPYRPLPWSPQFAAEFKQRRGYALAPLLPALVADSGPRGLKARYAYWQTVGELVSDNFFGQIQEWCHRHHVLSGGHLLAEEMVAAHPGLYGDFFRCIRRLDAPSIDCLTSIPAQVPWTAARLLASAGELTGKSVVMCETSDHSQRYRPAGDTRPIVPVTEEQIRGTCNRLIYGGVNVITSYYSFAGLKAEQLRRLNNHIGRCCTMLTGGHQVTDLAVLYPSETLWTHYTPSHQWAAEATGAVQVERAYYAASDALYNAGRDFTYVDGQALREAKAQGGALVHGDLSWRVIVLPKTDTLPRAAWENLARFWRQGGVVIALGALPANSESEFPSPAVQALTREMFGTPTAPSVVTNAKGGAGVYLPPGSEALLPVVVNGLLEADVTAGPESPLRATHRRLDGHDVYFIINDSAEAWSGDVSVCAAGAGEQWDPATGKAKPLAAGSKVALSLEPYGATLLRFPQARAPQRHRPTGEALPGMTFTRLPAVEPLLVADPAVEKQQAADTAHSRADSPAWQAIGTLKKGNVNTHLFACLQYPQSVDLSGATCLAVEAWVPAGQRTTAELLVILRDQEGGEYLANTGCSLSAAGRVEAFVPASAFKLAGWSKDADGRLDWGAITDVRIG
ncbi:MAG: glycosyl hydrolase, partial [Armatimonadota bacterium]